MQENRKRELGMALRFGGALILCFLFFIFGIMLAMITQWNESKLAVTLCNIAVVLIGTLLVASMVVSHIAAKWLEKKYDMSVRQAQECYLARREEAVRDLPNTVRQMIRMRRAMELYWVVLVVLCLLMVFLSGIGVIGILLFMLPLFMLFSLFLRIPSLPPRFDFSDYTAPDEYPALYALAHRAAAALGMDGRMRILLTSECNAGIAKVGRTYSLQLGGQLLDMLSEEELYQVLLHEFAHMTKDGNHTDREFRLFNTILGQEDSPFQGTILRKTLGAAFRYPDMRYTYEYSLYRLASSIAIETVADRAVIELGDPQIAANMMAKLAFHDCFDREKENYVELFYLPEQMRTDALSYLCRCFRQTLPVRESAWRELLSREIQANEASHPILRLRIQALGISDYTVILPAENAEGAYYDERRRVLTAMDRKLCETYAEEYPQEREARYLEPLRVVEDWRANGEQITAEEARPLLKAMNQIGLYREAEALCDRLLAETDNPYVTAHFCFYKGIRLLHRYDKAGIAHIYRAIESNHYLMDEGLNEIGQYCCAAGWQTELEEYRERSVELYQFQQDVYSKADGLAYDDCLVADTMPDEMREKIVSYIREVGEGQIERIYLVRKIVNDDYFNSAFIMEFAENSEGETIDRIMDKIYYYLDTYPEDWHFSIHIFDLQTAAIVEQVAGCCVYDASEH